MRFPIALISLFLLSPRGLFVNAKPCMAMTVYVVDVIITDRCDAFACRYLTGQVAANRVGEPCKAADPYGDMILAFAELPCQDCAYASRGCACGVTYKAWRMYKNPHETCSCEAIADRAAGPVKTAQHHGYCTLDQRHVKCTSANAAEMEARAVFELHGEAVPDSIRWDPKLYVGHDPEILAQVERELAEQRSVSPA